MKKQTAFLLCIMAGLLCAWSLIAEDPFTFLDSFANFLPEALQMVLVLVMMPFMLLHNFSFMIGTGILGVLVLRQCRQEPLQSHALRPLVFPLLSMVWLTAQAAPFLCVPAGSSIRPMGWAMYTMLSALVLMLVSLGASIASLRKQKRKTASVVAILLSLAIIVVPSLALQAVAQIKGFNLSP